MTGTTPRIPTTRPGLVDRSRISVKALAVILDPGRRRLLVFRARNQAGEEFNRPLGGTVELGERTVDAVVREIREEIGATFLYIGSIEEPEIIPDGGRAFDDVGASGWAGWRPIADPPVGVALYPDGLQARLDDWLADEADDDRA